MIIAGAAVAALWVAAFWDLRTRRVPNILTFGIAGAGLALQLALAGTPGLRTGVAGFGVGLVILLPGYLLRATGAGDVKLMAAAGTILGPLATLLSVMASIAVGGAVALGFVLFNPFGRRLRSPWRRWGSMSKTLLFTGRVSYVFPPADEVMGRKLPFALSIAIGTTATLIWWWSVLAPQLPAWGG